MEGKIISVGPWGLEEGIPFCQMYDGILRKIVLIYDGGFKALTAKYSTSNTHECCGSNELSRKLQKMLVESPNSSNIIKNADFREGMNFWRRSCTCCQAEVVSSGDDNYAIVSSRRAFWHSIEQDITEQVYVGSIYEVSAEVSVKGGGGKIFPMGAALKIENLDASFYFVLIGRVEATDLQWARVEGVFSLNTVAKSVRLYFNGLTEGVDLLIRHVSISPVFKNFVIKLEHPEEYLTGISGYSRKLQQGMSEVISSLTFKSNLRTYGPYGTEQGKFFSFNSVDSVVIGFHGTSDNYLKSIGLYLKPLQSTKPLLSADHSMLVSSSSGDSYDKKELMLSLDPGPWGGKIGNPFDDGFNEKITQILLTKTGDVLSSITTEYERNGELIWSFRRGSLGTNQISNLIKLNAPDEYLVRISGYWRCFRDGDNDNVAIITSLTFFTNKKEYGPVGEEGGAFFSSPAVAGRIRGFFGRSGKYLNAIGVHMQYLPTFSEEVL
ncbi:jacalin-related lectin 3-like [Phalaenopsis equestris]|uniref:jacalin-related lectin 3-like n=1 Tax=Phalaenopsis equestris TaxID=78828 RepID=UPI0009E42253|nr:jacalin-related lectin 3-like [Phalaenopsis equestris]